MIYLSIQPDINYFHWQVEVYLNNFVKVGIDPSKIHVVLLYGYQPSLQGLALQKKYPLVNFFFYKDERDDKSYIPSIKPWGVCKHLSNNEGLNEQPIFYHDADIIFREKINEDLFVNDDIWYLSDTVSYIGYEYCASKGIEQLTQMVDKVGITLQCVKENQLNSGGAQYIIKNTTPQQWYKIYKDSNMLYYFMDQESKKWTSQDYPIQKWCAEMWATLWNAWFFGHKTIVHKELDFSFATAPIEYWFKYKIMHNAGVTPSNKEMFFKGGAINRIPFNDDFSYIDPQYCSSMYVQNLQELATLTQTP